MKTTVILLQNTTKVYDKTRQFFLLQNEIAIKECDDFITNCVIYHKMRRLFQNALV